MYERVNELLGTEFKSDKDIDWDYISEHYSLSEPFIREFKSEVNWDCISIFQVLCEDFIREFKEKVNWSGISLSQYLSEPFIREFENKVSWSYISTYQVLSEEFIREFEKRVKWDCISQNQLLSWKFILEFEDRVDWDYISTNQFFINFDYRKINKENLKYNDLYYLYQKTKNRGWFFGYIEDMPKKFISGKTLLFFQLRLDYEFTTKARIYWKDIKLISRVNKFNIIRRVRHV